MHSTPRRILPSHSVLRSFEAAARHCSFTLAAEELHLTQSAISRQVKELEQTIGTPLFRRVGRRVVLTQAGESLAKELTIDLENIRRTMMRAIAGGAKGTALRVACLPAFASRWLIPRLPLFSEQHPDIEINLSTRLKPFDLDVEHFDLAIHFGRDDWPNTDMAPFCSETMVAVSSPDLMKRHQMDTVEKLAAAPLLHMTTRPTAWEAYFDLAGLPQTSVLVGKYFDQFSMIIAGAVASLGVGLLPTYLIEEELANGKLVLLNAQTLVTKNQYFLVRPSNQVNPNVSVFCDWMHQCIASR
ncbi:LysR substrate-binding domain-containing protein [Parasedimentitalea huanghaiensis]|uniref:LysR family transcriptional regulator n=1 Tax=Parasedimentitalea huanghaiensis TaxID=2682100 RepID=A0A6L6WKD4_9RHOB|nr:LysR substrate-binding domain-containing protein [Zongyanglinia huanghaiensis]MVO17045.1 LysR family transcriptional regulator [Zongyanglinia huanghaiensis]